MTLRQPTARQGANFSPQGKDDLMVEYELFSQKPPYRWFLYSPKEDSMADRIKTTITIRYEADGRVFFWWGLIRSVFLRRSDRVGTRSYMGYGVIPAEISKQSKKVIRQYARDQSAVGLREDRSKIRKWSNKIRAINFPITTTFKGKKLKGRVVWSNEQDGPIILMESPIQAQYTWRYGESFAGAMCGHRKFTKDLKGLDPLGRKDAEFYLIYLYRSSLCTHKPDTEIL